MENFVSSSALSKVINLAKNRDGADLVTTAAVVDKRKEEVDIIIRDVYEVGDDEHETPMDGAEGDDRLKVLQIL